MKHKKIKVNDNKLTKKEQEKVVGGDGKTMYYCRACGFRSSQFSEICPDCGVRGGFAVAGISSS